MSNEPIVSWSPQYDLIVALALSGRTKTEIAAAASCSTTTVSHVLDDPRAQHAMNALREKMVGIVLAGVQDELTGLAPQAVKNLRETIETPVDNVTSRFKKHQDQVSLELLDRIGFGKKDRPEQVQRPLISSELESKLVAAMERSDRARARPLDLEEVPAGEYEVLPPEKTGTDDG